MKVLMGAFACEPHRGSEEGVGWNWALAASESHEVWVLTSRIHREAIEAELARSPIDNLHFVYHSVPFLPNWYPKHFFVMNLYYRLWQVSAIGPMKKLHEEVKFALGHQVTYVTFRHPTFLAWLDIPFIWGPLSGGDLAPFALQKTFGRAGTLREIGRSLSVILVKLDPFVRHTARRANVLLAVTPKTFRALPSSVRHKALVEPAIAIPEHTIARAPVHRSGEELRLLFVGNLLYLKGVELSIRALGVVYRRRPEARVTLTIVGDGKQRDSLEDLVHTLELESVVTFVGRVPPSEVADFYRRHHMFVFPSYTDSGGFAVIEAMASGLPVIALELAGPEMILDADAGIRVPVHSLEQVVSDLAASFELIYDDEPKRLALAEKALARARDRYTWTSRSQGIRALYSRFGLSCS